MGTFKSGIENIQLHHWSNAKPAQIRQGTPDAQMPLRGRPRKSSEPSTPQSTSPTKEAEDKSPSKINTSGPDDGQTTTEQKVNKAQNKKDKVNKLPERRSERIRKQNHATSIAEIRVLTAETGPPSGHPFLNAGNSNSVSTQATPAANRCWSASKYELEIINRSINGS